MSVLKHLANWLIWMLIPAAFVFILSVVFSFSYIECVHAAPFIICYFFYALGITVAYFASLEESNRPMSFIK